ncbi:hypothetical protein BG015_005220 [Linnemannia schmuckeri]|uniref:Uncharacterized protein n=1 Tax=Linnemannia schmuckeri TaxID=64567 RepID=A0A9P5R6U0_9FUNG|nr:hypothetical protein BG015_005220 [Linnemannia schmuckeri]
MDQHRNVTLLRMDYGYVDAYVVLCQYGVVESLVHMFTDAWGYVIRFGVLNEAENVLQLASVWKQKKKIYNNGRLYMMCYNYPEKVTIDSFPFTEPIAPPLSTRQILKGPKNFDPSYFFAGTRGSTIFLGGLENFNQTEDHYEEANSRQPTDWEKGGIAMACFVGLFLIIKFNNRRKVKNCAASDAQKQQQQSQDIELGVRRTSVDDTIAAATTGTADTTTMTYQDQIANLEFASHPQPYFVTTISDSHPAPLYNSDEGQALEYSRHRHPNVITSVGSGGQS